MKRFVLFAFLAGLTLFSGLVAWSGLDDVAGAVASAGWATLVVVLARAAVVAWAGLAWGVLFPPGAGTTMSVAVLIRFVREGVNQLLPVGQVGGDFVGARLATFWGRDGTLTGAVTIADVALQAVTQLLFAMAGVAVLVLLQGDGALVRYAAGGLAVAAFGIGAFFVVQGRAGSRIAGGLVRRLAGLRADTISAAIDKLWARLKTVYATPRRVAASTVMHLAGWVVATVEVYVALHAMGYPVSWAEAFVIESLGQAVRGAAFAVPGGLGVQEGGFAALCALFGVPAGAGIALSLVKRVPDFVLGLPALAAWQILEGRQALRASDPVGATPMTGETVAWLVLLKIAGAGILYLLLAGAVALRFGRRAAPAAAEHPAVTIFKPLHGAEPGLYENLASFAGQDYPAPVQIVLGVQSAADPAIAEARRLKVAFPDLAIDLVVDGRQHGTNRKVSNLINMAREARHEVWVLADSDMRVEPDYLRRLAAELGRAGTGAVTCPYHGLPSGSVWADLAGLAVDTHFLPGVVLGASLGAAEPCMGSTIALRRDTLERIGGFSALADTLADDYELGARVRALGLAVRVAPFTVGHVCPERSLGDLVAQELRWQRTIRQVAPGGHVGSLVAHPLAFAVAAFVLAPGPIAASAAVAAVAARVCLCLAVERAFGLKPHRYWLVPARDLLSFVLLVASFLGRRVSWRGQSFEVARSGALVPTARPDPR